METVEDLLDQPSPLMEQFREAEAACTPYATNYPALLVPAEQRPCMALPGVGAATVGGSEVISWQVTQATFLDLLESIDDCPDRRRWAIHRVAEQVSGFTAHGTEVALSLDDVRALPVAVGKSLTRLVMLFGDVVVEGAPEVVQQGDGINKPLTLSLTSGERLTFQARTVGQLEDVAAGGTLVEQVEAVMELTDTPEAIETLTPADGWAIMTHVVEPLSKLARKTMTGIRSYEFALKMQFDPETSLRVVHARQVDYGKLFEKRQKANEAAARSGRPRGRARR